jgi:tight adherence protein C
MTLILLAGLAAIFTAALLALAGLGVFRPRPDPGVTRSLAAVGSLAAVCSLGPGAAGRLRDAELAVPFGDRVLEPVLRCFTRVGRRLTPDERMHAVRHRLDLAGNPAGWDADRVVGLKALCCLTGFVLGLFGPPLLGAGMLPTVALCAVGAVGGWYAPSGYLYQVGYDRSERIRRELPDALDLMTISVEAGLAFDAAMSQVARRTPGPLAKEFFRVLQEMQIGTGRAEAMRALGERTDVPELRAFIGAMVQADELGVPVAGVLRVQAGEMRVKRSQRAEELAQKVPVKILFPLILCIMPCLFIVVMGPAAITLIRNFSSGGF